MNNSVHGLIIRSTGDRMTVMGEDGKEYISRARGKFRTDGVFPLVGDKVELRVPEGKEALLEKIYPRENELIRPPCANVSRMILVVSAAPPVTGLLPLDTLLAAAEQNNIPVWLVVNKIDLAKGEWLSELYSSAGYPVFRTSTATGEGIEELSTALADGITVFSGSSGVGKSSLLNALLPGVSVKTSDISEKIGRGRHTTRHVELFHNRKNGYFMDTPGFSSVDPLLLHIWDKEQLPYLFPEFRKYLSCCRYADCRHTGEDGCAVREAMEHGRIAPSRWDNYCNIREKIENLAPWQIRTLSNKKED